jgi:hypothetical protein
MIRHLTIVVTFVSALLFPWPLTAALAFAVAFFEPLIPFAVGLFIDTLYYTSNGAWLPLFTACGGCVSAVAFFVRSRVKAGIL